MNARWLGRQYPKCRGVLAITVRPPQENPPLQAVNGRCIRCGYRMAWVVIRGKRNPQLRLALSRFTAQKT